MNIRGTDIKIWGKPTPGSARPALKEIKDLSDQFCAALGEERTRSLLSEAGSGLLRRDYESFGRSIEALATPAEDEKADAAELVAIFTAQRATILAFLAREHLGQEAVAKLLPERAHDPVVLTRLKDVGASVIANLAALPSMP